MLFHARRRRCRLLLADFRGSRGIFSAARAHYEWRAFRERKDDQIAPGRPQLTVGNGGTGTNFRHESFRTEIIGVVVVVVVAVADKELNIDNGCAFYRPRSKKMRTIAFPIPPLVRSATPLQSATRMPTNQKKLLEYTA